MAFVAPTPTVQPCRSAIAAASPRTRRSLAQPALRRRCAPRMATAQAAGGPARSTVADTPRKEFLDRLKPLGKVRLVARNEAAIMESIATFDGLFFATIRSGEYANIIDMSINLDMHLLLNAISGAKFEIGQSRSASKAPTYAVRVLLKDRKTPALSVFMQWEKDPSDIGPERVEAWKKLKADYVKGDEDTFFFDE